MRKYLYINNDLVNSTLAQLSQGIVNSVVSENGHDKATSSTKSNGKTQGIDNFLSTGFQQLNSYDNQTGKEYTQTQKDIIEKATHDYAVNILENELKNNNLLKTKRTDIDTSAYLEITGDFKMIDFSSLDESMQLNTLSNLMSDGLPDDEKSNILKTMKRLIAKLNTNKFSEQDKIKYNEIKPIYDKILQSEETYSSLSAIKEFSNLCATLFTDIVLIKLPGYAILCDRKYFKDNLAFYNFINSSSRKVTVLGYVQDKVHLEDDERITEEIGKTKNLWKVPNFLTGIVIKNFNLAYEGDYLIQPIAVYF